MNKNELSSTWLCMVYFLYRILLVFWVHTYVGNFFQRESFITTVYFTTAWSVKIIIWIAKMFLCKYHTLCYSAVNILYTYLILEYNTHPNPKTSIIFLTSNLQMKKEEKISVSSQENTSQKQISYICFSSHGWGPTG